MNILTIGNSFSQDATHYLYDIARADGVSLAVTNLYIGGCSLERHFRNMLSEERAYELEVCGHPTAFYTSIKEAVLSKKWDVITLQQVSHDSFMEETYFPYVIELAAYIRRLSPAARLLIHETWAYEEGSERLRTVAGRRYQTRKQMHEDIVKAYRSVAEKTGFDGLIPSGELVDKMLDEGLPHFHRDTFHAALGVGRYALALLWYRMLTGANVKDNAFSDFDEAVSEDEMRLVKRCVDSFTPLSL